MATKMAMPIIGTPIIRKLRSGLFHFVLLLLYDSSGLVEHPCSTASPGTHVLSANPQVIWGGVGDNTGISEDCQAMRQAL
jgi:hypothetical protein